MNFTHTSEHQICILCGNKQLEMLRGYERHPLVKCQACSMVFMRNIPSEEELEAYYNRYAYTQDPWVSPITIQRYHTLLDKMEKFRKNNLMLDVGCGAGHFLAVALSRGWEVFGNEFSPAAIELCNSKGIKMVHGSIASPFSTPEGWSEVTRNFDVITSLEVIEHMASPHNDLGEIYHLLRSGGLHYCTTPNFNAMERLRFKAEYQAIGYPEHLSYYTSSTLHKAFEMNGFKRLKMETTGMSFTRIAKSRKNAKEIKIGSADAPDEQLRQKTEHNLFWRFIKRLANQFLRITNTGATIKAWYLKG